MGSSQEDEGFEALLKPIQDVTRNWEVDLSLHLEEYITYIRQICGDNVPCMNFAQAAVLIQNSANIYSKKVDFLFTTVLKLLDVLSKKQTEEKNKQMQEDDPAHPTGKRRRPITAIDTEEFAFLDNVCVDRELALNFDKEKQKVGERKKQKIVLNAAIKVKAKEKTSCNVYHSGDDVMGKKEEFRLNWRICSTGTVHEEFVIKKNKFKLMEPVEVTVHDSAPGDDGEHNYDDNCSNHSEGGMEQALPDDEPHPLDTTLVPTEPVVDRQSEEIFGGGEARTRREPVRTVDVRELEWQANDFNTNLPDKPIKKKRVVKIPASVDEEKKRKNSKKEDNVPIFSIMDIFIHLYHKDNFNRDVDFSYPSNLALKFKHQMYVLHREKYIDYMQREAGIEQIEGFRGYYIEDYDSDHELDFMGFDPEAAANEDENGSDNDNDNNNDDLPEVDVPLPERESILEPFTGEQGWKGDEVNSYNNEAMKTLQAFRSRKIDHGRMTDMARRVAEWHQKITPKLEAAEQRSSFDIHAYGTKVLDEFSGEIGLLKPFTEIVGGKPREEVARYFLATLVLANQYNVEISETESGDLNTDCVQLKLLSTVRHHDEMDDNLRQTADK